MLLTEWSTEEAKEVWYEEGREEGREEKAMEIARNALAEGLPIEVIQNITGLGIEAIRYIQMERQ